MFKLLCMCAVIAVVAVSPKGIEPTSAAATVVATNLAEETVASGAPTGEDSVQETQDDMDRAETFGFGYRKYIHIYPRYYPRYFYGGYYPRYYYGHYGHYW